MKLRGLPLILVLTLTLATFALISLANL